MRPSTSGSVPKTAPIRAAFYFDILNFRLLFTLLTRHIVRWNTTEEKPKVKPKRGTFLRNALKALNKLLLDSISIRNLKSAVRTKFWQNGIEHFEMHSSHESLSQQHFSSYE